MHTTSFITNGCSSSSSSSSSGGSGSSSTTAPTVWSTTFIDNQTSLEYAPVSRGLTVLQRTAVSVSGEQHFVGVKSISGTSAVIEVSSTPQQGTLSVGQSKKFELNGDAYYDLLVTLVSISGGTANVTMTSIHESLVEAAAANQVNSSTNQTTSNLDSSGNTGLWITIVIVLIVVGGAAYYFFYIKNKPNYD